MKEINSQLYGLSYELDASSESDKTTCYAVDTGTVFISFGGKWHEQPAAFWCQPGMSDGDLYGYSANLPSAASLDDLTSLNLVDTGERYVAFQGVWYPQPVSWSAVVPSGSDGGSSDIFVIHLDETDTTVETAQEIYDAYTAGKILIDFTNYIHSMSVEQVEPEQGTFYYRLTVNSFSSPNEQSDTALYFQSVMCDVPVSEAGETGFDFNNPSDEWYWSIPMTPDT